MESGGSMLISDAATLSLHLSPPSIPSFAPSYLHSSFPLYPSSLFLPSLSFFPLASFPLYPSSLSILLPSCFLPSLSFFPLASFPLYPSSLSILLPSLSFFPLASLSVLFPLVLPTLIFLFSLASPSVHPSQQLPLVSTARDSGDPP